MKNARESGMRVLNKREYCDGTFTTEGAIYKTLILSFITILSLLFSLYLSTVINAILCVSFLFISLILTITISFTVIDNPKQSKSLSIIYCVLEGFSLGFIMLCFRRHIGYNTAFMALFMLLFVVFVMTFLYKMKLIKVTFKFKSIMLTSLVTIVFGKLIFLLFSLFGVNLFSSIGGFNGLASIVLSIILVIVGALYIIVDLDFIDQCKINNAPKYMEWFCALNLMITIIWLFVEILELLIKIKKR